jgi:hypothetical protein
MQAVKAGSSSGNKLYQPFSALYVVMNEVNQVVSYKYTHTKGNAEVALVLGGLRRRYELQVGVWPCVDHLSVALMRVCRNGTCRA